MVSVALRQGFFLGVSRVFPWENKERALPLPELLARKLPQLLQKVTASMLGTGAGCGGGQSRATPVPDILLCTAGTCQNRNMSGCLQVKPRACACLSQTLHVFAPSSSIHDHIHIFQCMQACCTPTFYAALQKYEDWHC